MARKYTGTSDGAAKGKRPGTEKLQALLCKKFGCTNLGTWVVRDMRGKPGQLSVHATGRAADTQPKQALKIPDLVAFLEQYADVFEIEEIHQYKFNKWGRGWRCNRNGKPGWKNWTAEDNGGTPGATWVHWEISPKMADDAEAVAAVWRQIHGA